MKLERKYIGWMFVAVVVALFGRPVLATDYGENDVAHWPHARTDPNFKKIIILLEWCEEALKERFEAVGRPVDEVHEPTYLWPLYDVRRFSSNIGEVVTNFVDQTRADTDGSFDTWFDTRSVWRWDASNTVWVNDFPSNLPMWTLPKLLKKAEAGSNEVDLVCGNFTTNVPGWKILSSGSGDRLTNTEFVVRTRTGRTNSTPRWHHEDILLGNWGSIVDMTEIMSVVETILLLKWTAEGPGSVWQPTATDVVRKRIDANYWWTYSETPDTEATEYNASLDESSSAGFIDDQDWGGPYPNGRRPAALPDCAKAQWKFRFETNLVEVAVDELGYDMGYDCRRLKCVQIRTETRAGNVTTFPFHDYSVVTENFGYAPEFDLELEKRHSGHAKIDVYYEFTAIQYTNITTNCPDAVLDPGLFAKLGGCRGAADTVSYRTRAITNTPYTSSGFKVNRKQRYEEGIVSRASSDRLTHTVDLEVKAETLLREAATSAKPLCGPVQLRGQKLESGPDWSDRYVANDSYERTGISNRLKGQVRNFCAVLKWRFRKRESNRPTAPEVVRHRPDTERDDVVDIGVSLREMVHDTGLMTFLPDRKDPYIVLPMANPPDWFAGLDVMSYLTEIRSLPYIHQVYPEVDTDGYFTAYNLNTRILDAAGRRWTESATNAVCPGASGIDRGRKRALLLRPHGNTVIFDFKWNRARNDFSVQGYPIREHGDRTFVLYDMTPGNHDDLSFRLQYLSGVFHEFCDDGRLAAVSNLNHYTQYPADGVVVAGAENTWSDETPTAKNGPVGGSGSKYEMTNRWNNGKLEGIIYTTADDRETVSVSLVHDNRGFVQELSEAWSFTSTVAMLNNTGDRIDYENGTGLERMTNGTFGSVHTATHTWTDPDFGRRVDRFDYNDKGRLIEHRRTGSSVSSNAITRWTYPSGGDRYKSGLLHNALMLRQSHLYDATFVSNAYDASTGWLEKQVRPGVGDKNWVDEFIYPPPGDSIRFQERPKRINRSFGGVRLHATLYAWSGPSVTRTHLVDPNAAGATQGDLVVRLEREPADLLQGLMMENSLVSAGENNTYSNSVQDGVLTTVASLRTQQNVGRKINPFGYETFQDVTESNAVIYRARTTGEDSFGRPLEVEYHDNTSRQFEDYTLFGPGGGQEFDESGIVFGYSASGYLISHDQPDIGLLSTFAYDSLGHRTLHRLDGSMGTGPADETHRRSFDAAGRTVSIDTPRGSVDLVHNRTSTIGTYDDGSMASWQRNHDYSPASITGNGIPLHEFYNYGITGGQFFVKHRSGGHAAEFTVNRTDALDRSTRTDVNGLAGSILTEYEPGSLRTASVTDQDRIIQRFTYGSDTRLQRSGLDLDRSGGLETQSSDPLTRHARSVTPNGIDRARVVSLDASGSSGELVGTFTSHDNLTSVQRHAGVTATAVRQPWDTGATTETVTYSDGTKLVRTWDRWLLHREEHLDRNGNTVRYDAYEYDGLGALTHWDSSLSGSTRYTVDASSRRVTTIDPPGRSPMTLQYHNRSSLLTSLTLPDGDTLRADRRPDGVVERIYDGRQWDRRIDSDLIGRRKAIHTVMGETRWTRNDAGLVKSREIGQHPAREARFQNNGLQRQIENEDGIVSSIARPGGSPRINAIGHLNGDPGYSYTQRNRLGHPGRIDHGPATLEREYRIDGRLTRDTSTGRGSVAHTYRPGEHELAESSYTSPSGSRVVTYGGDPFARVATIDDGTIRIEYAYEPDSDFVRQTEIHVNGSAIPALTRNVVWDRTRRRIDEIEYRTANGSIPARYTYTRSPDDDRMTAIEHRDGSTWTYTYDPTFGHLTAATCTDSNGVPRPGCEVNYGFDAIGNLLFAHRGAGLGLPAEGFQPDDRNLHTQRTRNTRAIVTGSAAPGSRVTVNGLPATVDQQGDFQAVIDLQNTQTALGLDVEVLAARRDPVTGRDIISRINGDIYVPQATERPRYRQTADPRDDTRYAYDFDPFGQLLEIRTLNLTPNHTLRYTYDGAHRRTAIHVYTDSALTRSHTFLYDHWNIIEERIEADNSTILKTYHYGLDLFGQLTGRTAARQSAGGIGALIGITMQIDNQPPKTWLVINNHQGTTEALLDPTTGTIAASYVYTPFGTLIEEDRTPTFRQLEEDLGLAICPFRYSGKYHEPLTGLLYYGFRYYDPATARWLGREPLGESASLNLLAFCHNDPVNNIDYLGLDPVGLDGN
ncbi:MAG: RHS repeat-associated core domain-containing protein, partial [Verrucomicrobiota bacterium]